MTAFTVTVQTDNTAPFTDDEIDTAMELIDAHAGTLSTEPPGNRATRLTIDAPDAATAADTAAALARLALGGTITHIEATPDTDA